MNNNNNDNTIEVWENSNTITISVPNSGDPYDTTTDAFFIEGTPIHGAGNLTNETVSGLYREIFKQGDLSVAPGEECPICMDEYNTTDANTGVEVFPNGFAKCPVKFICGFICCFDCLWNWINEKGAHDWNCFSCRAQHSSAIFLKIEELVAVTVPDNNGVCDCHETIKDIVDALETAQKRTERLSKSKSELRIQVAKLEKSNTNLKKQIANLKRKLEVSMDAATKKGKFSKKGTLFPEVARPHPPPPDVDDTDE